LTVDRRTCVKSVLAAPAALTAAVEGEPILYFVDGYHGGVRGHMPKGAWRDIVTRLGRTPGWKLCLDIEPASWVRLAEDDPQTYSQLASYLQAAPNSARVEMVGGTFSQPYGWALTGESNIRQLVRGLEVIRASFPHLPVDTYAMQEPCWASCLPQILSSLGFKAAVLKNPSTAWGGYSAGIDAETVNWIGPDGASIRTVPRYACEELLDTWRTEAQTGSLAFARKCVERGIEHPAGMCFQDLGWAARPNVKGDYISFTTWREYMQSIAGKTVRDWRFSMEDIRCALPWGEKTLQNVARQVRSAENRLLVTEKLASMAAVQSQEPYPADEIRQAWDQTLWAQHHDAWITATTRSGRDAWAFQIAAETWTAESSCSEIIDRSLDRLTGRNGPPSGESDQGKTIRVFNTLGHDRPDLVELEIATDPGTKAARVRDSSSQIVASQFEVIRKYVSDQADRVRGSVRNGALGPGESVGAGRLLFRGLVPATGEAAYTVETVPEVEQSSPGASARVEVDGSVTLETDLYRIRFDPSRGGSVSSLFAKQTSREFCQSGERRFHEFRGYFIEEKNWASSAAHPAKLEVLESGPIRATVSVSGLISSIPFRTSVSLVQGEPRIDFHTQFRFEKDTWIGDPWEIKPELRMTGRRRSEYDDRYKLLALFPVSLERTHIYKNAAFDVCKSQNSNTFFQTWDTIKHNIAVNWVDLVDEREEFGVALFTDHTTSYAHGEDHPLSLVLGWGWDGGFWWGKCPLKGLQESRYSIVPHGGRWEQAALWRRSSEMAEPLLARLASGSVKKNHSSLVRVESPGLYLTAMTVNGRDLLLRFFNAESPNNDHEISLGMEPKLMELVELDGRVSQRLRPSVATGPGRKIKIHVPRFGIRTVRVSGF